MIRIIEKEKSINEGEAKPFSKQELFSLLTSASYKRMNLRKGRRGEDLLCDSDFRFAFHKGNEVYFFNSKGLFVGIDFSKIDPNKITYDGNMFINFSMGGDNYQIVLYRR